MASSRRDDARRLGGGDVKVGVDVAPLVLDTAGTARYVKNAASWLINAERFGDAVVSDAVKHASAATSELTRPSISAAADPFVATRTIGLIFAAIMVLLIGLHYLPALHRHE